MIHRVSRQFSGRGLAVGVALFSISVVPWVHAKETRVRDSGVTLVNDYGFSLNTYPRSGTLARVRVRFERGFAVKLRSAQRRRTFGYYTVEDSDRGPLFGWFMIPAGTLSRTVPLVALRNTKISAPSSPTLSATLTMGTRPVLVITGFPKGATKLEFGTSGTGQAGSYITSPCVARLRAVRGSMLITTRGDRQLPGTVAPGVLCGVGAPHGGR